MNKFIGFLDFYKQRIALRLYFKKLRSFNDVAQESQYLRTLSANIVERMVLCSFRSQCYKISPPTGDEKANDIKANVKIKNRTYPLFIYPTSKAPDNKAIEAAIKTCRSLKKRGLFIYTYGSTGNIELFNKNKEVIEPLTGQLLQELLIAKPTNISQSKLPRILAYVIGMIILIPTLLYASSIIYFLLNKWIVDFATIRPWSILEYASLQPPYAQNIIISLLLPLLVIGAAIALYFFKPKDRSSRWAKPYDLKKARLLDNEGILLGKYNSRYLRNNDPTHCFTFAPTGSGKGVGVVIPNLLDWTGSLMCLDVKGENHELTSGYRASLGHKIINFTPFSEFKTSHCYNPFDYVSDDPQMIITDLQLIASILVACAERADPHFPEEAQDLFIGLALYILDKPEYTNTIGSIFRLLGTDQDFKELLPHIAQTFPHLHESAKQLFNSFGHKAEKERSGIKSTLGRALKLWRNSTIDAVTAHSDFSFYDLRKRRHAIYFGVGVNHMDTLAPLIRIFFEQAINVLTAHEPNPITEPRKVLMLLDEIHILGPMKVMSKIFTLLRSYNVRIIGIVQNLETLDTIYSKPVRNTIIGNCAHRIFFACTGEETKRYVSQECGETQSASKSVTRDKTGRKVSITQKWVPLLKDFELGQLGEKEEIILVEGHYPVKCKKLNYRFDKTLAPLACIEPVATPNIKIVKHTAPTYNIPKEEPIFDKPKDKKRQKPKATKKASKPNKPPESNPLYSDK